MSGLYEIEFVALSRSRAFLESIEKTEVSRSYKIVLLLALISAEAIPGDIEIDKLTGGVAKLAGRYLKIREDFSVDVNDMKVLRRLPLKIQSVLLWMDTAQTTSRSSASKRIARPPASRREMPSRFESS